MQLEMKLFGDVVVEISEEEWRVVPGFPRYEVSSFGRFRNRWSGKYMSGACVHNGYLHIGMMKNGRQIVKLAHRVVAEAFLEKPSDKHEVVNHKNKDRKCNRVTNLEWVTRSYNAKHAHMKL